MNHSVVMTCKKDENGVEVFELSSYGAKAIVRWIEKLRDEHEVAPASFAEPWPSGSMYIWRGTRAAGRP